MKKNYFYFILFIILTGSDLFAQVPVMNPILGPSSVCSAPGSAMTFSASASNSPTSYMWTVVPSAGVIIANPNAAVTSISFPYSNGTYTIYCTATNGSGTSIPEPFVVNVFETPTVTFSGNTSFCQGSSTYLQASSTILAASSTINYFWSPGTGLNTTSGPFVQASPTIPTTYTVTATIGMCSNSSQITVTPLAAPTININVSNPVICFGDSTTLTASGAITYTWTGGINNGVSFTPSFSGTYFVTGTGSNGCTGSASASVTVNPVPFIAISSTYSVLCTGQSSTLTISGSATSHSINGVPTTTQAVISPTTTTTYSITGTNSFGCSIMQMFTQNVSTCIGIKENNAAPGDFLKAWPNPNNGCFYIKSERTEKLNVINEIGQIVQVIDIKEGETIKISNLSSGIYFISNQRVKVKIVIIQ